MKNIYYIALAIFIISIIALSAPEIAAQNSSAKEIKGDLNSPSIIKNFDNQVKILSAIYKVDEDLARKIIKCESTIYKHKAINENLDELGNVWSIDVGYWQINDYWHEETAKKLGFDIYDEWDNLEYGFYLFKNYGTKPWKASEKCWKK
jgi:hypothetical protein